ncbi:hypothetical protein KL86CLO1_10903 [uncultured Eubacteriales bacterium]|uniref:Uncharacterized protein n=1 Tax=uncultured Eubacteriales bacterium TaxID=172733 RepID=A0A212JDA3_9FIRM|nr:hypothetical protein KL86CLO1_10903 [uncultured Eubacteriales bacterium]
MVLFPSRTIRQPYRSPEPADAFQYIFIVCLGNKKSGTALTAPGLTNGHVTFHLLKVNDGRNKAPGHMIVREGSIRPHRKLLLSKLRK